MILEKVPYFASEGFLGIFGQNGKTFVRGGFLLLYCASYLLAGLPLLREAVGNLFKGKVFGEDFLMAVATVGAIAIGEYSEACAVMILFQLGEFFEDKAVGSSRRSISKLLDIRPDTANLKTGDKISEVPAEQVKVGETIVIKAGERVPLDGVISTGSTTVDTSALTGESLPRELFAGDPILSGFVNISGTIEVKVTKEFGESTASRVLEMVEKAREKKSRPEKFITRFAKVYTPIVCLAALLLFILPPLVTFGFNAPAAVWKTWLYRALELLVVSCPCAFVISVPLSFFAGMGAASSNGILVKGSAFIDMLSKTRTVVFDKTGTLTKGVFQVSAIHPSNPSLMGPEELLALATHAEYFSEHPISLSLKKAHSCPACGKVLVENAQEIAGHGIKCLVDGKKILAGNMTFMQEEGVSNLTECNEDDSGTVIHVALDGEYKGHIVISDLVKEDAKSAVGLLRGVGVKKVIMLTGDNQECAKKVADELGLDGYEADLLPQDKLSTMEKILASSKDGEKVAFVGDGINDSPVLSRADVGIAMGAMGSDAAVEAADVVIMDDMPSKTATAVKIARRTMANVRQNVAFALSVKTLIMVLCALGIANMWVAVFGDVGVTMLAVLNSMRLLKK